MREPMQLARANATFSKAFRAYLVRRLGELLPNLVAVSNDQLHSLAEMVRICIHIYIYVCIHNGPRQGLKGSCSKNEYIYIIYNIYIYIFLLLSAPTLACACAEPGLADDALRVMIRLHRVGLQRQVWPKQSLHLSHLWQFLSLHVSCFGSYR